VLSGNEQEYENCKDESQLVTSSSAVHDGVSSKENEAYNENRNQEQEKVASMVTAFPEYESHRKVERCTSFLTDSRFGNMEGIQVSLKKMHFQQEKLMQQINKLQKNFSKKMGGLEHRVHVIEREWREQQQSYRHYSASGHENNWYSNSQSRSPTR